MHDYYSELVQSNLGKTIAKNLGLPTPVALERFDDTKPIPMGEVIAGFFGEDNAVKNSILQTLSDLHAHTSTDPDTIAYAQGYEGTLTDSLKKIKDEHSRFKVAIFDATNLSTLADLQQLYEFFHPIVRKISPSGRIIVIARPDCCTNTPQYAATQNAVLGFVKSLAKEIKRGVSANVIYLKKGLESQLDSTLRFFISPKSAYISGQPIYLTHDVETTPTTQSLAGKKIAVTGAGRGIGHAICKVLAQQGVQVVAIDLPIALPQLQELAQLHNAIALSLDITDPDAAATLQQSVGVLDGIVHNAGITQDKTLANMSSWQWESVMAVNLMAVDAINTHLLTHQGLSDDGRIVCVSSISAIAGNAGQTNYATSKAGIIGLVKASTKMLKSTQTINAVAPGFIETQMTAKMPFALREAGRRMNSMSQGGEPVDVAHTVAWLLSPASGALCGNVVRVCGQSILGA